MPLSSLRFGSGPNKSGPSQENNGSCEIPLESHRKNGFTRLDKDRKPFVPPSESEVNEQEGIS